MCSGCVCVCLHDWHTLMMQSVCHGGKWPESPTEAASESQRHGYSEHQSDAAEHSRLTVAALLRRLWRKVGVVESYLGRKSC